MTVGKLKEILEKYDNDTHIMLTQYGTAFDIQYIDESKIVLSNKEEKDYKDIKHLKSDREDYIENFEVGETFINIIV